MIERLTNCSKSSLWSTSAGFADVSGYCASWPGDSSRSLRRGLRNTDDDGADNSESFLDSLCLAITRRLGSGMLLSAPPGIPLFTCAYDVRTLSQVTSMGTTRVNFRIPEELVEKADVAAKITHKSRAEIVTEALRIYLDDIEDEDAFKEDVVRLYLNEEISFNVLEEFIGQQDAESVRASKTLLDQGDELAEDLADL